MRGIKHRRKASIDGVAHFGRCCHCGTDPVGSCFLETSEAGMIGKALANLLQGLTRIKRPPDFLIGGSAEDPYMLRWFLIPRNGWFNIYLHHMRHDDDDRALHDHPWWSASLCLQGILVEHLPNDDLRVIVPGKIVFRSARHAHRLVVTSAAWTIFVTGPRVREWGFLCPQGWRHWKDFVAQDNHGSIGRGCGE